MAKQTLLFREGIPVECEIPEKNLLYVAYPAKIPNIPDQNQVIEDALQNPVGCKQLEKELKAEDKVVILVDDITRPTPTAKILPQILKRIHRVGIKEQRVKIIMAMGTHRPMTEQELRIKLGQEVVKKYTVINRDYRETSKFVFLGMTESGTPIEIDKEVLDATYVIALGNICPHISAGWSGGSKLILPGICSQRTTDKMHYMACTVQPVLEILGVRENKPRQEMDKIAAQVGLKFIFNTVLDEKHNIIAAFAGHFIEAHRQGCAFAEKLMVVPIPQKADILIVSAHPCHFDYWQGIKPYTYGHRGVRDGGVYIFMLDGTEGLCGDAPSHDYTVRTYLLHTFEQLKAAVESGEITDIVGVNVPMYHSMVRHRTKNFLVTNHLSQNDVRAIGFEQVSDIQSALNKAFKIMGQDARVGLIPYGGETLVRTEK